MKKKLFNKFLKGVIVLTFIIGAFNTSLNAQALTNGQTFTTPGTYTIYTVPLGVTSLTVECWGAGGGGSHKTGTITSVLAAAAYSAGGGGGNYTLTVLSGLTPGSAVTVVVGSGGAALTGNPGSTSNGNPGGYSALITTVNQAQASGGQGGQNGGIATGGGGNTLSGTVVPSIIYVGGNSNNNATANNSSAGGGAGTLNNGGTPSASSNTGGIGGSVGGGAGGNGGKTTNPGNPGTAAGGGGAGSRYNSTSSSFCFGGAGGDGMVVVSFTTHTNGSSWLNQNCSTCATGCYIDGGLVAPSRITQVLTFPTNVSNYGYVFWTFNASADSTYYFDLCSSTGVSGNSWLRLHNAMNTGNNYCMDLSNTPTLVTQNNANGCSGTGSGFSKLIWTCPKSGTYYLESADANLNYWGASGSQTVILTYKTLASLSTVCSDIFYDMGIDGINGSSFNYNNNESWIHTYYPLDTIGSAISAQFVTFSTAPGDILCVYDGNSINAPVIGCYSGPSITGAFSSTASNGSLTFQFSSDSIGISAGWQANISCIPNVGIGNHSAVNTFNVYPNPTGDQLTVTVFQLSKGSTIELLNIVGERVSIKQLEASGSKSQTTIDVSGLPSGIYFVRIQNEMGGWNARFVKS